MPDFEECCLLIPAATLEDFPADLSDYDARSTLAAWTVLWHPQLLAATGQLPNWFRADSPPDPKPGRLILAPAPSLGKLPADFQTRAAAIGDCHVVTGGSRTEFLENIMRLGFRDLTFDSPIPQPLVGDDREIGIEDFFAAGYASLQIQVMTRRLRYTSNLDEIHLQNRTVQAAKSFLARDARESIAALHDVFDCLAEERDHYFSSSDPHLIDLTLVTPSTIDDLLNEIEAIETVRASDQVLATPKNVLIDQEVAETLAALPDSRIQRLRDAIAQKLVGWAGGGPSATTCLDAMTLNEAQQAIAGATQICSQAIGSTPSVFARFSGGWSGDLTWSLMPLGYKGVIPIDFAAGTGYGDEAKVLLETGGVQIEALTAKPIDASSDAAFLTLGTRLGESIDGGEISTALFAHWPGQSCDSFNDVRRASSWSLCLGRFWNLDNYFSEGEHPYHHGNIPAASKSAANLLETAIEGGDINPISNLAARFCDAVSREQIQIVAGLANLISGDSTCDNPTTAFADAVVSRASAGSLEQSNSTMLINSASIGCRETLGISHSVSVTGKHIFAVSQNGSNTDVTVDVPACGFVMLDGHGSADLSSKSFFQRFRGALSGGRRSVASKERSDGSVRLQNEFMEVVISPTSGGIAGVYSGSIRGNRFSMKLVRCQSAVVGESSEVAMECKTILVGSSSQATGSALVTGYLRDSEDQRTLAEFEMEYRLKRGSRLLQVTGKLIPSQPVQGEPWLNYYAARAAVAGEAAIYRPLIRDKVHRGSSRRFVSPLGMVIDEAERQTLIGSCGLAFHRHLSDRFLDTLLAVQNESNPKFELFYGFDISSPVATARAMIAPPTMIPIGTLSEKTSIGWIIHPAPKTVHVSHFRVDRMSDGRLAGFVRLIQTRSQPCQAMIRFLRDVESAVQVAQSFDDLFSEPPKHFERQSPLETKGDRVSVPMPSHGVVDLLVIFRDSDSA